MKNRVLIIAMVLLSVVALSSCTTYKESMVKTTNPPLLHKLPIAQLDVKASCFIQGEDLNIIEKTIRDEMENNILSSENCSNNVRIEAICDKYALSESLLFPILSGASLFTLNVVGMPIFKHRFDVRFKFDIIDNNDKVIKSYKYNVTDKSVVGFYYGRNERVVLVDVTKKAITDFRKDIERDALYITEKISTRSELPMEDLQKQVQVPGNTTLKQTIIHWDVQSRPQDADVFWRVVSNTPEVKNTYNKYLQTTPYEADKVLDIRGLTIQNYGNLKIILRCEKEGYRPQEKEFELRMVLDQEEISAFFRLAKDE